MSKRSDRSRTRRVQLFAVLTLTHLAFLAASSCLLPSQDDALPDRLRRLEARLEEQRVELHVPGLAIAVVKDGEMIWAKGLGLADVEKEREVTPETIFAVGSTTKAFTATLAGMLVDEGKLDWDAPITEYLPDFQLPIRSDDEDAYVCLRDMFSHRTGFARGDLLWANGKASSEQILATVVKAEPWRDFREEFHYNNIMFVAAGAAEAAVTGKPWNELIAARILAPLSMRDTTLSVAEAQKDARLALGYRWDEEEERFVHMSMRPLPAVAPAGAINSNVVDMAKWVRFQLARGEIDGERLISEESHRETWTKQIDVAGPVGYGLGWMLQTRKGQPVVEHGGNIDGFAAQVALLPESSLGFVLLANVGATPLQSASMNMVWEALLEAPVAEAEAPAASDRAPYFGVYSANFGVLKDAKLTVLEEDGKLAIDVPGQMVYALREPDAEGRWYFELTDQIAISFDREGDGPVTGLKLYQSGKVFEAPREGVEIAAEIDLDEARRYLGQYSDPALKTDLAVVIQNNRLAVDIPKQMVFELHKPDAEGKRAFRIDAQLAVRFDEDSEGTVTGMTVFERGSVRTCPRAASADPEATITADALHELRGSDARKAALDELRVFSCTGTVKMSHVGIEGTMTLVAAGTDRYRTLVDLEPFATIESCYDLGFASTRTTIAPYQELSGKYAEKARVDHPIGSMLDWRDSFQKTIVLRSDEVDGRKAWVVKLVANEGIEVTAWVDAATGDTLREDSSLLIPGIGEIPQTTMLSDFRVVHGLRVAHHVASEDPVNGKTVFVLETLETLQPQPESLDDFFRLEPLAQDR